MKRNKIWRWLLLPAASAVLLVTVGLVCLAWPAGTLGLLPRVLGLGLVAAGLVQLWFYFGQRSLRFLPEFGWIVGAASLLVGAVFLFNPHVSMVFVGICGGIWSIVLSLVRGRAALRKRDSGRPWKTHLAGCGLYLACGVGLLFSPFTGVNLATQLVGLVMVAPFMPVFFFISSMVAGLSMVIFEGTLSHKALHNKMDETHLREADGVVFGFGRAASFVLIGYFIIKVLDTTMDNDWHYLASGYGAWFAVEMVGFVLLPAFLYALGVREKNITLIRVASVFGVLGIVVNRFNVCLVAFNWQLDSADRYFPSISEVFLSIFIVTLIVTAYRFVCSKMPVLYEHPDFKDAH